MGLSNLVRIPVIMRRKGWNNAAWLLEAWFARASHTRASGGVSESELRTALNFGNLEDWVLKQKEGKEAYDKIFSDRLWKNRDEKADARLARLLGAEGKLNRNTNWTSFNYRNVSALDHERNRTFLNLSSFKTGAFTELTHIVAALGSFVLKFTLNGQVKYAPNWYSKNRYLVKPESINIYLWDLFDFEGDQPLGCWDEDDNSVGKIGFGGKVCVGNDTFRRWRQNNHKGGDFYIYSNIAVSQLTGGYADEFEIFDER
jgi:hypothetical protein